MNWKRILVVLLFGLAFIVGSVYYQLQDIITEYLNPTPARVQTLREEATGLLIKEAPKEEKPEEPALPQVPGARAQTVEKIPTLMVPLNAKLEEILARLDREKIQEVFARVQGNLASTAEKIPIPSAEDLTTYKSQLLQFGWGLFLEEIAVHISKGIIGVIVGIVLQLIPRRRK